MYSNEKGKEEVSKHQERKKQKLINHSAEDKQGCSLVAISFRFDENSHSILVLCFVEEYMVKCFK